MRLAIDIGHPAHVHFFKHFIREMEKKGHECLITAVDKDIACTLLDAYGFAYTNHGAYGRTALQKFSRIPVMDYRLYRTVKSFNPDLFLGVASIRAAHVAFLMRKRCVIFDDTETGKAGRALYLPFVDYVCTPPCYLNDLGKKHVRSPGYHELAYLHPDRFTPNPNVLKEVGISPDEPYVIMRFVAWEAVHDLGHPGLTMETKRRAVEAFSKCARVFISSEQALPAEFEPYRISVPIEKIHQVMAYASLLYGDSCTMSTECAALGVPVILVHYAALGNMIELDQTYGCILTYKGTAEDQRRSVEKGISLLEKPDLKARWQQKRARLLNNKIDVTQWMIEFVSDQL